jgi:hypothetical protein
MHHRVLGKLPILMMIVKSLIFILDREESLIENVVGRFLVQRIILIKVSSNICICCSDISGVLIDIKTQKAFYHRIKEE